MRAMPCVGILDSGIGGLGVLFECLSRADGVRFYYFGDTAHAPYGSRTEGEIASFVEAGLCCFGRLGADAAVLACNTATAVCAEAMRKKFPFPVVGTEPAVRTAAAAGCRRVLVLATPRTAQSTRLSALIARERDCVFSVFAPPDLASAIERAARGKGSLDLSSHLPQGRFDGVVLGCTHYTLVGEEIAGFYGAPVFDGNAGTARRLLSVLGRDARPPIGISDHRQGGLTTNKRFQSLCEQQTKNEVIFLNSTQNCIKMYFEQMFSPRLKPKKVQISQKWGNFF